MMGSVSEPPVPAVAGSIIEQHLTGLEQEVGTAVLTAAVEALTPEVREELLTVSSVGWASVTAVEALYGEVAHRAGRTASSLHRAVGAAGTEQRLRTIWRVFLRFTSDEALVARAPLFYAKSFNTGALSAEVVSPGRAHITLTDWPDTPEFAVRGVAIGVKGVLEAAGRKRVKIDVERQEDGARFTTTWGA